MLTYIDQVKYSFALFNYDPNVQFIGAIERGPRLITFLNVTCFIIQNAAIVIEATVLLEQTDYIFVLPVTVSTFVSHLRNPLQRKIYIVIDIT